jgi:hypothetical protein
MFLSAPYTTILALLYSYDWVFVFKVRDEWDELNEYQKEYSMKRVVNLLTGAGIPP